MFCTIGSPSGPLFAFSPAESKLLYRASPDHVPFDCPRNINNRVLPHAFSRSRMVLNRNPNRDVTFTANEMVERWSAHHNSSTLRRSAVRAYRSAANFCAVRFSIGTKFRSA